MSDERGGEPVGGRDGAMAGRAGGPVPAGVRQWTSEQLLGDRNEAWIEHCGEVYRLLRTRNQKLILVK